MAFRRFTRTTLSGALAVALLSVAGTAAPRREAVPAPLTIDSARVSIAGTSNIHAYTASTTAVRLTRIRLAGGMSGPNFWEAILEPGVVEEFEISIAAGTLSSPKDGLDKNMHKALNVKQHPEITFRLIRLEPGRGAGALRAVGVLRIAGVEREIVLDITARRAESTLTARGEVQLLMTDYGITPPKAMLGMLKTDPRVTVTFEAVLAISLT